MYSIIQALLELKKIFNVKKNLYSATIWFRCALRINLVTFCLPERILRQKGRILVSGWSLSLYVLTSWPPSPATWYPWQSLIQLSCCSSWPGYVGCFFGKTPLCIPNTPKDLDVPLYPPPQPLIRRSPLDSNQLLSHSHSTCTLKFRDRMSFNFKGSICSSVRLKGAQYIMKLVQCFCRGGLGPAELQ